MNESDLVDLDLVIAPSLQRLMDDQRDALQHQPLLLDVDPRDSVSIKQYDTSVKTQFGGTCTSFAVAAAMENWLIARGTTIELSERSLWDYYGKYTTEMALMAASNHWLLEEKFWPQSQPIFDQRNRGKGRFKLGQYTRLDGTPKSVHDAIARKHPCVAAMSTPRELLSGQPRVYPTSAITHGGHAVEVCGFEVHRDEPYFLVKNSWGPTYGDGGYQWVAFGAFRKPRGYVYFYEIEEVVDRGDVVAGGGA